MNTNIALIGASGSGVTTFISEMYNDIKLLAPKISINEHPRAVSVHSDLITPHTYDILAEDSQHQTKSIVTFTMNDYKGTILKEREAAGPAFFEYENELMNSQSWIILIDSHCFTNDSFDENVKAVVKSCARNIMPFLSDYIEKHNNTPPEIVFAVTKCESVKCSNEEMTKAVMEAFKAINQSRYIPVIVLSDCLHFKSAGLAVLTLLCNTLNKISTNNQNNNNNQEKKTDDTLKYILAAAQCLIINNDSIIVNGFDKYKFECNLKKVDKSDIIVDIVISILCVGIAYWLDIFIIGLFLILFAIFSVKEFISDIKKYKLRNSDPFIFKDDDVQYFYNKARERK